MSSTQEESPSTPELPPENGLAALIARQPPLAAQQITEVLLGGQDAPLETALMLERKAFQLLFASRDKQEGMQAFLDKRKPQFEGR